MILTVAQVRALHILPVPGLDMPDTLSLKVTKGGSLMVAQATKPFAVIAYIDKKGKVTRK